METYSKSIEKVTIKEPEEPREKQIKIAKKVCSISKLPLLSLQVTVETCSLLIPFKSLQVACFSNKS